MAISVVGQASAAATSVAFPVHAVGDMLLVFTRGTVAAPSVPAAGGTVPAWVTLQTGTANSIGVTAAYFVATATTTTTGAWTNAAHICVLVLRPGAGKFLSTSAARSSVGNGNNTQTIIYPALTLALTDGTSMGVRCGTRTVAITAVGTAPTSWTNQSIQPAGASALMSVHTRAALAANPVADTVTVTSSNAPYRAVTVEVQELGALSVTAGSVSSAQSFGTVATAKGPVSVSVTGKTSAQAFSTTTAVGGSVAIPVGGVFPPGYVRTITGQFLVGDGHRVGGSVAAQFGAPTGVVTVGTNVSVTGKGTSQAFGTLTLKATFTRTVTSVFTAQGFGSLAFRVTLGTGGVLTAQAFGTVTPKAAITRSVSSVSSAQSFGAVTFSQTGGPQTRTVTGLGSAQTFGATTTTTGPVTRSVTGLASAQLFGSVLISGAGKTAVPAVSSAQSFGSVTPKAVVTRQVTGLGTAQAFGSVATGGAAFVSVTGKATSQAFGSVTTVKGGVTRTMVGLGSPALFGTVTIRQTKQAGGVPSAQTFGPVNVYVRGANQTVQVLGIGPPLTVVTIVGQFLVGQRLVGYTGTQFGHPAVFVNQVVPAVAGVPSGQQFGTFIPKRSFTVQGVQSAQAFGAVRPSNLVTVGGVQSAARVGVVHLKYPQWVPVTGVTSAGRFGKPVVLRSLTAVGCNPLPSAAMTCTTLPSVQAACQNLTITAPAAPTIVLDPAETEDLVLTEA